MPDNMGFPSPPPPRQPSIWDRLQAGLLGGGNNYGGLLGEDAQKAAKNQAMMAMAAQLMQAGGPSPTRTSFGQALGQGLQSGMQAQQGAEQQALQTMLVQSQIKKNEREKTGTTPASVQEYEYAKANGFKGSYQEWVVAGGQTSRPSAVQEWEFYNSLPTEQKPLYLEMKRNPNFYVKDVNQVPTVIRPSVSGTETTALSTLPAEIQAASWKKEGESKGSALGTAAGALESDITKKGSNAVSTQSTLEIADPLIDLSTGSSAGAARDQVAAFFGKATSGAEASAQLKVLQASLMTSMPRMEGPQSDADVKLYQQAAGQIGDPTVPNPIKKAAVQTIRQLQQKYIDRASQQNGTTPQQPKRSRADVLRQYGLE
jgi:hypothetical protein